MKAILFALCLVSAALALSVQVEQPKIVKNDEWCSICQFVLGYIEGELANNRTEENIIHVVESVCDIVPKSLRSECTSVIAIYGEDIINLLINDEPASVVCAQIGLCDSKSKVDIQAEIQKSSSDDCSICQLVMGYIESELGNNYTQSNIEQVLDSICTLVPSAFKAQCTSLINEYTSQLIQLLLNEETPQVICQQIGLCSSSKQVVIVQAEANEYCTICEFVLSTADQYLADNATDKEIILFIENVCYILPSTVRQECDDLIATYATEIITLLIQDYPPNVVCTEIGLCSSAKNKKEKSRATPTECQVCVAGITAVEKLHLPTPQAILQALLLTCDPLPQPLKGDCQTFFQTVGQAVIVPIQNNSPPQSICANIGVCTQQQ